MLRPAALLAAALALALAAPAAPAAEPPCPSAAAVPAPGPYEGTAQEDPNARFVARLYGDLLRRDASAAELRFQAELLELGGISRRLLAEELIASPGHHRALAAELYGRVLRREPTPDEVASVVRLRDARVPSRQVLARLLASPEYLAARGGRNECFLEGLYDDVLGRPLDESARAALGGSLDAGTATRWGVALSVLASPERGVRVLEEVFRRLLRRPVDAGGLAAWQPPLARGLMEEELTATIMASDEYVVGGGAPAPAIQSAGAAGGNRIALRLRRPAHVSLLVSRHAGTRPGLTASGVRAAARVPRLVRLGVVSLGRLRAGSRTVRVPRTVAGRRLRAGRYAVVVRAGERAGALDYQADPVAYRAR